MKIVKYFLFVIIGFVVLLLVTAAFLKKEYSVERSILIEKPKSEVFNYMKMLQNQDKYSVWSLRDPNMKKTYKGTDGTVGALYSWESENEEVGVGEQEIKAVIEGERIDYELRFKVPFEATEAAHMAFSEEGTNTKVIWGFNGKMDYPMNLMLLFMDFEGMIGSDLQEGLNNAKKNMTNP